MGAAMIGNHLAMQCTLDASRQQPQQPQQQAPPALMTQPVTSCGGAVQVECSLPPIHSLKAPRFNP
jgi:hypothetical protein